MQFPWRDFAWFTILIGLAIGLAVEQHRLQVFSAARDRAERAERNAHEVVQKICNPFGGRTRILISHDTILLPAIRHGQPVTEIVNVPHVLETKEKDESYLTGMEDLDSSIFILLVMMPLLSGGGWLIRKTMPAASKARAKVSVRTWYLTCLAFVSLGTVFALKSFYEAKPFGGTLMLCSGIFFLCIFLSNLAIPTTELARKIEENQEKNTVDWQTLKAAFRLPLRDFFWLTIVIGLSALLVVEHKRTRALSEHPYRAEWWSSAERLLQEKQVELSAK